MQQQLGTDRALATVRLSSPFLTQASTDEMIATINAQYEPAPCTTEECQRARDRFKDGPTYPPDVCKGEPECEQLIDDLYDHLTEADVAAMTAGELSYCHQKASARGDKSHPCYGGTCSAEHFDNINQVDSTCKPIPGNCRERELCKSMDFKIAILSACEVARQKVMDRCFKGGDKNHKSTKQDVTDKLNICLGMYPTCSR